MLGSLVQGNAPGRRRLGLECVPNFELLPLQNADCGTCSVSLRVWGWLDATAKVPDTLGSLEGNTEGPGTTSSEPLLILLLILIVE